MHMIEMPLADDDVTVSDNGTFVSVDNFMTSTAPSPMPGPSPDASASQREQPPASPAALTRRASDSFATEGDRSSFIWGMGGGGDPEEDDDNPSGEFPDDAGINDDEFTSATEVCGQFSTHDGVVHVNDISSFADIGIDENTTLLYADGSMPAAPSASADDMVTMDPEDLDDSSDSADAHGSADAEGSSDAHASVHGQLFQAAAGMTSFQVDNPFETSVSAQESEARLVLFSRNGPFTEDEVSTFEVLALNSNSPDCNVLKKLVETILFQRREMCNFKKSAEELGTKALYDESRRHSEVKSGQVHLIDELVSELDGQRREYIAIEAQRENLRDSVKDLENMLERITAYCRQINPRFSLSSGVKEAFESVFAGLHESRRESAQQVAEQHVQLEGFVSRVMKLEQLLDGSMKRNEQLHDENMRLKRQLAALEGESTGASQDSPASLKASPMQPASPHGNEELLVTLQERTEQVETLQQLNKQAESEKKKVNDALLSMNVDLDMALSKVSTLHTQRDAAERNCRKAEQARSDDKKKYTEMAKELTANIVNVIDDLDMKEAEVVLLHKDLEDREQVVADLKSAITTLEQQLAEITSAALTKSKQRSDAAGTAGGEVSRIVDTVMQNLRSDLDKAQELLQVRSNEVAELKKASRDREEILISLRRECGRLGAVAAVRTHVISRTEDALLSDGHGDNYLRRLSVRLGASSDSKQQMVSKLVSKVEQLTTEKAAHEDVVSTLRSEVMERERALHVVRSEMQAEISTVRADAQHLENMLTQSRKACQFAENKLLEVLGGRDLGNAESTGDLTESSVGTRRLSAIIQDGDLSRRQSLFSLADSENTVRWNDPLVEEAIQSCDELIQLKERLASRLRALREKMDRMIKRGETLDGVGSDIKELMIESKEIQADLSGVVDMQQGIIDNLRGTAELSSGQIAGADDTLPYLQGQTLTSNLETNTKDGYTAGQIVAVSRHARRNFSTTDSMVSERSDVGQASAFLREQLKHSRDLYNEKSKANADLLGVLAELREDLSGIAAEKNNVEGLLRQVTANHDAFLARLSDLTGAGPSVVAIEEYVRATGQELRWMSVEVDLQKNNSMQLQRNVVNLTAQKHFLCHFIGIYQWKYRLNLLIPIESESKSAIRRFRVHVFATIAMLRFARIVTAASGWEEEEEVLDISQYNVPSLAPIGCRTRDAVPLMDGVVAISAVPRLESAIADRDNQIVDLRATISALDNGPASPERVDARNGLQSSFAYNEDVVKRKGQLTLRLRKALREKAEAEMKFSHEREVRISAEAKVVRYSEKLAAAKKKLSKASAHAESKERTYKAAIKYLKHKTDKAVEVDSIGDENADPWATPEKSKGQVNTAGDGRWEGQNAKSLAMLQEQMEATEQELKRAATGSEEHEELSKYIQGLHKAMKRLKQPRRPVAQGPRVVDGNIAA